MDSLRLHAKTEKKHIAYVNFIIEAYEGMAVVRTADPEDGLLEILVSPDFEGEFRELSSALAGEIPFRLLESAAG